MSKHEPKRRFADDDAFFTRRELCKALGIGKTTLRHREAAGKANPVLNANGVWLYSRGEAERLTNGKQVSFLAKARAHVPSARGADGELAAKSFRPTRSRGASRRDRQGAGRPSRHRRRLRGALHRARVPRRSAGLRRITGAGQLVGNGKWDLTSPLTEGVLTSSHAHPASKPRSRSNASTSAAAGRALPSA